MTLQNALCLLHVVTLSSFHIHYLIYSGSTLKHGGVQVLEYSTFVIFYALFLTYLLHFCTNNTVQV